MKRLAVVLLILFISMPLSAQTDDASPIPPQVAQLGRGKANTLEWHPNGEVLAVGGSLGLWLYDENLEDVAYFPESDEIIRLAWSPDGNQLAMANWDGIVRIWDVSLSPLDFTLNREWTFSEYTYLPMQAAWSPDGDMLAILVLGGGARILDVMTGEMLLKIPDLVSAMHWNPDGTQVVGEVDLGELVGQQVRVWEIATGNIINTYHGRRSDLRWVNFQWTADGATLVGITTFPVVLHTWDVESGDLQTTDTPAMLDLSTVYEMWWIDDSGRLMVSERYEVTPGSHSRLLAWDAATWTLDQEYSPFADSGRLTKRPDKNEWTLLSDNGQLITWSMESDEILASRSVYTRSADVLVWSPDSTQLAASQIGLGPNIQIWSLEDMAQPTSQELTGTDLKLYVEELRWSDDGSQLIGSLENAPAIAVYDLVVQWDVESGESPEILNEWCCDFEPRYAWNSDFTQVASRDYSGEGVTISNVDHRPDGRIWAGDPLVQIDVENPTQILWSPNDTMLAVLSKDDAGETSIWVYDAATGEIINTIMPFMTFFQSFTWSPDSTMIAVSGSRSIVAADTTEYRLVVAQIDPKVDIAQSILNLAQFDTSFIPGWNPDSSRIAATTPEGIGVYDLDSIALVANNPEPDTIIPTETIYSLAWSPDGQWLAGGHEDGTIRIWDVSGFSD